MKNILIFTLVYFFLMTSILKAQVIITLTDQFITKNQMLLANEINESGEPFAEFLGYNLDDLDPMILNQPDSISYTLGIENYEYSRYLLGTVISRSGIGLHMMWGPVIMQKAAMEPDSFDGMFTGGTPNGYKNDDELMKNIMHFAMLSNGNAPLNPWPQFAEFQNGNPHIPQAIAPDFQSNFESLRWDRDLMDKTLNIAALGQTLMKQYLWAQDMLGSFHDSLENVITPDGTNTPDSVNSPNFDPYNNIFYGGNNADGFIGQVLTAEAINKTKFVIGNLAYDGVALSSVDPATYDPSNGIFYFPHKIAVSETPIGNMMAPKPTAFNVVDEESDLFDQLSYLWGTLSFKNMMDPNNNSDEAHIAYHSVFDGNPFPAPMSQTGVPGPFDLMKGTSKMIFLNLMAMHFNSDLGTFVNTSILENGSPILGNEISTVNAGYITMVLTIMVKEFAGTPLESMALNAVNMQSNFIINTLKDSEGGFYNGYVINQGVDISAKTAVSQASVARGLYAAYSLTGNNNYLMAADDAYNFLINNYYVPNVQAFKTEINNNTAIYTPFNFAVIAGGLREAVLVGNHTEAATYYTRFFKKVANAMQMAEFNPTGETGGDSDNDGIPYLPEQPDQLAPVFAEEAHLDLSATGIEDIIAGAADGVLIYPNPATDIINIKFNINQQSDITIEVFDFTGKNVYTITKHQITKGNHNIKWSPYLISNGMYFVKISTPNTKPITKKMVLHQ